MRSRHGQELAVLGVELEAMTVSERAQERARCGRGTNHAEQNRHGTVAQDVQVCPYRGTQS